MFLTINMKLQLFVLLLCIFKIAAAEDNSTTDANTTEANNATSADTTTAMSTEPSVSNTTETVETGTTDSGGDGNETTTASSSAATSGPAENNDTTTVGATISISSDNTTTVTPMPVAATTQQQNTPEESTLAASTASSNTTGQDTTPVAGATTMAASMASSNTTEQDTTPVAGTTTMAASMASSNTTEQDTTPVAITTTMAASMASSNTTEQATTPVAITTTMAATNPCLNTTVVQQCKDQDFTCVNDGQGQHHCESCLGGWTLSTDKCRKLPRVIGKVTIKFENGAEASFSVDLTNRNSDRFIKLAKACCESFLRASIALECIVTSFTEGSIIVNFELGFPENATDINQTALAQSILDDANATGIGLDPNVDLSVVTVFCENTTCENDGNCYINESQTQCNCTNGYTGSSCSISPTTTVIPTEITGLSTEVIIGIAVGCTLAVLIIIIIIIVVIWKCGGKNKVGSRAEMGRQQRDDEVPLQKR